MLGDQRHRVGQGAVAGRVVRGRPGQLPVHDERAVGREDRLPVHPGHLRVRAHRLLQYAEQRPVRTLPGQVLT